MQIPNMINFNKVGRVLSAIMLIAVILSGFCNVFVDFSDDDFVFTLPTQSHAVYILFTSYLFIISAVFVLSIYTEFIQGRSPPLFR